MPSGSTHLKIEGGLLFGWIALAGYLLSKGAIGADAVAAFAFAYSFSMLFLSPDLDLTTSKAFRRWGIVRWIWAPYARAFRHRRLSHHPIFGPLTRIVYLGAICALAGFGLFLALGRPLRLAAPSALVLVGALLGLYVPNLTHVLADRVVSLLPKRRGRRRL